MVVESYISVTNLFEQQKSGLAAEPFRLISHDCDRTWAIEAFIFATDLGTSFCAQRCEYELVIVGNRTGKPFITGDQPVMKLLGLSDPEVELFYPMTARRAMILSVSTERYSSSQKDAGLFVVEGYNFEMCRKSKTQLHGSDQGYLATFAGLPKGVLSG